MGLIRAERKKVRFDSFDFVLFLLLVLTVYHLVPHRPQNLLLLAASLFFYGYWDWRFLGLLLVTVVIDYLAAIGIENARSERSRRGLLFVSAAVSFGILAYFKYFNFFIDSMNGLLAQLGISGVRNGLEIVLPVGVSFYTFQTMSYVIDVYRRRLTATRRFTDFALFVTFFPQLVAGPIERASALLPQLENPRRLRFAELREGSWMILFGYYAKVVVADNLAPWAERAFHHAGTASPLTVVTGVYAFAFQIYGDFLGYSSIARGVGLLFGVQLMHNFRMPYFAANPSELWRRWHISLSTWLRDYVYIPLGGNRRGERRTYLNLIATMTLGGLWHGAAWHFVIWGVYHGVLLAVHRAAFGARERASAVPRIVRAFFFFQLVCVGWILFRVERLSEVPLLLSKMARGLLDLRRADPLQVKLWLLAVLLALPLLVVDLARERARDMDVVWFEWSRSAQAALGGALFLLILFAGVVEGGDFVYFQF